MVSTDCSYTICSASRRAIGPLMMLALYCTKIVSAQVVNFLDACDRRVQNMAEMRKESLKELEYAKNCSHELDEWFKGEAEASVHTAIAEALEAIKGLEKYRKVLDGDIKQQVEQNKSCIEQNERIKASSKKLLKVGGEGLSDDRTMKMIPVHIWPRM